MSERDDERRFCTSCGAPLRDDVEFCTSCGKPVPSTEQVVTTPPVAQSSESTGQTSSTGEAASAVSRLWSWVRGLPKWVFIAVGVLLLIALSPVTSRLAIIAAIILAVILIVQAVRRRPIGMWVTATVAAILLAVGLPLASNALYGGGGGSEIGSGGTGGESAGERQYGVSGGDGAATSPCDLLDPKLRPLAEEWAALDPDEGYEPLYLPTYVPFPIVVASEETDYPELYTIGGEGEYARLSVDEASPYTSNLPEELMPGDTVVMRDGEPHPYVIEGESEDFGTYKVVFGNASQGETIPLRLRFTVTTLQSSPTINVDAQEFYAMLASMVPIEPGSEC